MKNKTDAWDKIYKEKGKYFDSPHPDFSQFVKLLKKQKANKVLDLGSGTGRHTIHLANKGFSVVGIDISKTGVEFTRRWLKEENLKAELMIRDVTKPIPYPDDYFDAVISTQVIHHAKRDIVIKMIKEITRVSKSGSVLFVSVPLHKGYDKSRPGWKMKRIAERTYLPLDGQEKGLIHYFFTKSEFVRSFPKFNILKSYIDKANHFAILAIKK